VAYFSTVATGLVFNRRQHAESMHRITSRRFDERTLVRAEFSLT